MPTLDDLGGHVGHGIPEKSDTGDRSHKSPGMIQHGIATMPMLIHLGAMWVMVPWEQGGGLSVHALGKRSHTPPSPCAWQEVPHARNQRCSRRLLLSKPSGLYPFPLHLTHHGIIPPSPCPPSHLKGLADVGLCVIHLQARESGPRSKCESYCPPPCSSVSQGRCTTVEM